MKTTFITIVIILTITLCDTKETNSVRKLLKRRKNENRATPIILWHGMGDNCCDPLSIGRIKKLLEKEIRGVYVHSIMIGDNVVSDTTYGYFGNVNNQISEVCQQIGNVVELKNGYNAIGFSQGAQFLRGLVERCPSPPMKNLISVGGQQQGVYGIPYCPPKDFLCEKMRQLIDLGAYTWFIQSTLVQAQYWHDSLNENEYQTKSIFLADINNEKAINEDYKKNLNMLENFVLVKFSNDSMVKPVESEWFGFYEPNSVSKILEMEETRLYREDRIGLKKMKNDGKLHFLLLNGDHLQIPDSVFVSEIIEKFLK
ncbi:unnamed protein product [Dracunculus medinensis]|uniref:Palmitoyl-protein thioesterase 1 n=1 Tax=Dracunculus medinensis TaxID=318479 RepID=A0A0N4UH72_DRAME|nr:unnamed protein product [Dracunculus medinensis]